MFGLADGLRALGRFSIERRLLASLLLLVLSILAVGSFSKIRFENSIRMWAEPNSPELRAFDALSDLFGSDDSIFIAFDVGDAATPNAVDKLRSLERRVMEIEGVTQVQSLASVEDVWRESDGTVRFGNLVPSRSVSIADWTRIREAIKNGPLVSGWVATPDRRLAIVSVRMDEFIDEADRMATFRDVDQSVNDYLTEPYAIAGYVAIDEAASRVAATDLARLLPLFGISIACMTFAFFRSTKAVLALLLCALSSMIFTLAAAVLLDFPLTVMSTSVPTTILTLSAASSVHFLSSFQRASLAGESLKGSIMESLDSTAAPCFVSSITTAIGFGSFAFSPIRPMAEFGLLIAVGAVICGVTTLTTMPLVLCIFRPQLRQSKIMKTCITRCVRWTLRHDAVTVAVAVLLSALAVPGLSRIAVSESVLDNFRSTERFRRDAVYFNKNVMGPLTLDVLFRPSPQEIAMHPAEFLRVLWSFERFMEEQSGVTNVIGLPDFVAVLDRALTDRARDEVPLPDTSAGLAQYQLLLDSPGSDVSRFLVEGGEAYRITTQVKLGTSEDYTRLEAAAKAWIASNLPQSDAIPTGTLALNNQLFANILNTLRDSFGLAGPIILITIAMMIRSFRLLPVVAFANGVPILATLSMMGYLGIPINVATSMVATITAGLVVDDTVYCLWAVKRESMKGRRELPEAIGFAISDVGPAMFRTTLLMTGSFAIFCFADFLPTAQMGFLVAITMVVAFLNDALLVPALLNRFPILIPWKPD